MSDADKNRMRMLTMRLDDELWDRLETLVDQEAKRLGDKYRVARVGNRSAVARWLLVRGMDLVEEEGAK